MCVCLQASLSLLLFVSVVFAPPLPLLLLLLPLLNGSPGHAESGGCGALEKGLSLLLVHGTPSLSLSIVWSFIEAAAALI